jgi:Coenzyme PQQ synthesis protein D (PqqD)
MSSQQQLSADCVIERSSDVISAEVDQDLVMVSIDKGFYYGTSNVGREIWESIERPKKVEDLIEELAARYEVDPKTCEEQTLAFLEQLLAEALIKVKNASSG